PVLIETDILAYCNCELCMSSRSRPSIPVDPRVDVVLTKEEIEMNTIENTKIRERNLLINAVDNSFYEHDMSLRTKFGLDAAHPKTIEEAMDLIKEGKCKITPAKERSQYDSWYTQVRFGPEKDRPGYEAASKKLLEEKKALDLRINIVAEPEKMLKEVEAFKAKTFH